MTTRSLLLITAGVFALGLASSPMAAESSSPGIDVPAMPANLEVPAGNDVFPGLGRRHAELHLPAATTGWLEVPRAAGDAVSLVPRRAPATDHDALPQRQSGGADAAADLAALVRHQPGVGPRPRIVGRSGLRRARRHSVAAVEAAGTARARRRRRLAETTYIQRLNTSGGVAPATGCTGPARSARSPWCLTPRTTSSIGQPQQ